MLDLDPYRLAHRQLKRDRERMRGRRDLFEWKLERTRGSPFAFLRGSAPLFYEVLAERRDLRRGPPGQGWIVGDAHLENFGALRPGTFHQDELGERDQEKSRRGLPAAVFDLNDFDETTVGALRYDVLRLTTSLLLAARDRGIDASRTLCGAAALTSAYVQRLFEPQSKMPAAPSAVAELLHRVTTRKRIDLLNSRTEVVDGKRRFLRNGRYLDVSPRLVSHVVDALPRYFARLADEHRPSDEEARVIDVAFRVAGIGSLGRLRLAVLVAGKGDPDGSWVFEKKEEGVPAAAFLVGEPRMAPAKRVVQGTRACSQRPPRLLGTARLRGKSMLVRRLAAREDTLDKATMTANTIEPIAAYVGALLGNAHRRGAQELPRRAWKRADEESIIRSAVQIAAFHEAAWLAYFELLD